MFFFLIASLSTPHLGSLSGFESSEHEDDIIGVFMGHVSHQPPVNHDRILLGRGGACQHSGHGEGHHAELLQNWTDLQRNKKKIYIYI